MIKTATGFKVSTAAGDSVSKSPFVPDFIEKPYSDLSASLADFNHTVASIGYWLNPKNIFNEAWQGLDALLHDPTTAVFLMGAAIIAVIFRALDVKQPLRIVFWLWVAYWILRGFVFI